MALLSLVKTALLARIEKRSLIGGCVVTFLVDISVLFDDNSKR